MLTLPAEIREFISRHIPTTVHLDVLLLLASDERRSWSAEETAVMSGRQMTLTVKALEELRDHSLADRSDQDGRLAYRFAAATHEQRVQVRILQVLSRHYPVTVIRAISDGMPWRPAAADKP